MGINGLHSETKHYISHTHVNKYKGQRVACDASAWLHRGATPYGWAIFRGEKPWEIEGKDPPWVTYAMHMIGMLRHYGVQPVVSR